MDGHPPGTKVDITILKRKNNWAPLCISLARFPSSTAAFQLTGSRRSNLPPQPPSAPSVAAAGGGGGGKTDPHLAARLRDKVAKAEGSKEAPKDSASSAHEAAAAEAARAFCAR